MVMISQRIVGILDINNRSVCVYPHREPATHVRREHYSFSEMPVLASFLSSNPFPSHHNSVVQMMLKKKKSKGKKEREKSFSIESVHHVNIILSS